MAMPNWQQLWRQVRAALDPLDDHVTRAALWVGHAALAVLIASGEATRWVDYRDTLVSAPTLRAVHVLAGFVLAIALGLRVADAGLRALERRLRRRGVPAGRAALQRQGRPAAAWLMDAAWWLLVGLLVLSGLERYGQLRHGVSVLPVLGPAAWWALHRPLVPYLYAILLINGLIRGRLGVRRVLSYLYTP
jgi:hypothetical protein